MVKRNVWIAAGMCAAAAVFVSAEIVVEWATGQGVHHDGKAVTDGTALGTSVVLKRFTFTVQMFMSSTSRLAKKKCRIGFSFVFHF